jgi:hypothetical protein
VRQAVTIAVVCLTFVVRALAEPTDQEKADEIREEALRAALTKSFAPSSANPQAYAWRTNIVTTLFWIGEKTAKGRQRTKRAFDDIDWLAKYGGVDDPDPSARRDYIPVAFTPGQNPFYVALPYKDVRGGSHKPEAERVIPWFDARVVRPANSVCEGSWLAIRKGERICYAQWEDVGPDGSNDYRYVFQNERPKPNRKGGAGLAVSPAVRDFLGLAARDVTDWQFVDVRNVPRGPWRTYGTNNIFVIAARRIEFNAKWESEKKLQSERQQPE